MTELAAENQSVAAVRENLPFPRAHYSYIYLIYN